MPEKKLKMDLEERHSSEDWVKSSTVGYEMQHPSLWNCNSSLSNGNPDNQNNITNQEGSMNQMLSFNGSQEWDPRATLNDLSFLNQKIHKLQDLICIISEQRTHISASQGELLTQQQQLITNDLTSIIIQLISTAGNLLPSVKHSLSHNSGGHIQQTVPDVKTLEKVNCATKIKCNIREEEHESKDDDDGNKEHLPLGSYEILQLEKEEILAPHTHFCTICGKGFKRDANLRMHMRGHGDEYKTPEALAKPNKESCSEQVLLKRYSCPYVGCKRNKEHKKFQPLKTILCAKNHYKRTHCDKSYACSRCHIKKFSVLADLKTHEKHCGRDKWLCSCGTTFSRKDKLFGHIALFQGHTPAIPLEDNKPSGEPSSLAENNEQNDRLANVEFNFDNTVGDGVGVQSMMDIKGSCEDSFFSLLNYDYTFGGFQDFSQGSFDVSLNSFSFLQYGDKSGMQSGIGQ